ncbi:hypothetical protein [Streptococcus himalayensis]|uniref:Uncharacterized protein n=1 Tax=Streptococcus himalayensis TaxID=1888195 RepID=A0A917A4I3_9STRE|nr:hypothetical protein [Streptococcus himalayensis]QBX25390.1 hypothetical protein Javan254_0035 [Streptococcus phage Javan254]GGE26459.1 hypothetical protein GCM10011510_04560 [Streptococcus himalayensis]
MNRVKVDLQCPYCGFCKILKTAPYKKAISCPTCKQPVFLSWATGIEGELDEYGYYFYAYEPFNIRRINKEFEDVFGGLPSNIPYKIKTRGE